MGHKINYDNKSVVKKFLLRYLTSSKLFKGFKTYNTLIHLFKRYPTTIKQIINNIPKITYYKDYLRLLVQSKNVELNEYIYNLLEKQLRADMENHADGKSISTLAKWLPRQKLHFDLKLNFVDKMSERLFPGEEKFTRFKKYRKIVSELTKTLDPVEIKLCDKRISEISVDDLTDRNKYTYAHTIQVNEDLNNKLLQETGPKYNKMSYGKLMDRIFQLYSLGDYKRKDFESEIKQLNDIWSANKDTYIETHRKVTQMKDEYLVLDISANLINTQKNTVIKMAIMYLLINDSIVVNRKMPVLIKNTEITIFELIDRMVQSISSTKEISMDKIKTILLAQASDVNKTLLVLTDKQTDCIVNKNNHGYHLMRLDNCAFTVTEPKKSLCSRIGKGMNKMLLGNPFYVRKGRNPRYVLLKRILDESEELKTTNWTKPMAFIFVFLVFFAIGWVYGQSIVDCV
jgi:hypothetical protein